MQTLRQRFYISRFLRSRIPRMENVRACADQVGTVKFKFVLFCNDDLPDSYQIIPRTLIR